MGVQKLDGKILFITRALPVESGGTMVVIRRLLDNFDENEVVVLGRTPHKTRILKDDKPLGYATYEIPTPQLKGFRLWRMLSVIPGFFQGLWIIRKHNIKAIAGVYPDAGSLLLAALLFSVTRKPLLAYFCDLYMENQNRKRVRILSKWLQPYVFRNASKIMAANAGMKAFYDARYGVDSLLMPTAINGHLPSQFSLPQLSKPFVIGYSGSIVQDRLDPMQALIRAIGGNANYEIRLLTPQKEEYLRSVGLLASNVTVKFCKSHADLLAELSNCHLLYLPLTFQVGYNSREQLATCFGIKCYEYFQACRPVLVHCPPDYFTSTFFTSQQCGFALDTLNEVEIKSRLDDLVKAYKDKAEGYVENALKAAIQFRGEVIASRLRNYVNSQLASHASEA